MPSHSAKQAKVMSAIAHGWHPDKGSVAKIPVKVAKEFHAADAGHKYGKGNYTGGAVKSALNTARKYHRRKAEGGEVADDAPPDFNALKKVYISPKVDPNEGLAEALTKKSPVEGREPVQEVSTYNPPIGQRITNFLKGPDTPFYAPRADLVDKAAELHEATPWMQAKRAGENVAKGNFQEAALAVMPATKATKPFTEALNHAATYSMDATAAMMQSPQFGQFVAKQLKKEYGKTIAEEVANQGLNPDQIDNIKSYMSPGAQANFDKHYKKMAPKKEPSFAPALWNTPEIQATKPGAKSLSDMSDQEYHDYIQGIPAWKAPEVPASGGLQTKNPANPEFWNTPEIQATKPVNHELANKQLADMENFDFKQEPFQPHNENEFKPTGKDTDIEDYYAHQEKQAKGTEWEPPKNDYDEFPKSTTLTPDEQKNAPFKLYQNGKITHGQYTQKLKEALRPSDWSTFRPKDVETGKVEKLNFGQNKPEDLEKLGFNTQTPIYKGGYQEYASTYPEQLFNPVKKGSERAFFAATHKGIASAYGTVGQPYIARAPKFYELDWDKFFGSNNYANGDMHEIIEQARKLGADVVAIHNMRDSGSYFHGLHTQLAFLNTNVIRAPTAEFNPAKLHLAYPLAGLAGGGIFTYGALGGQDKPDGMAEGGGVGDDYNTPLSDMDEAQFQLWKQKNMPQDSGVDYDQRGAYQAQFQPQANGHWEDRFKKPNHPTFSDQSQYAVGDQRDRAGSWNGEQFIPPANKAKGGKVKEREPKDHEFINFKQGGLINSAIPGRTDKIPMKVSPGSYVLPADIPSALGQGNTMAGSDVLGKMFTHAAYGLKPMTQKAQPFRFHQFHKFAKGGDTDHVPIVAAGGEFIIHPDVVKQVGHGDIAKGHKVLDKFVLHTRAQHIKTLRKLKPPKP